MTLRFQFTHPQGVRSTPTLSRHALLVSIHAPARGAIRFVSCGAMDLRFNSRTRKGCDALDFELCFDYQFQFTHPQGVRSLYIAAPASKTVSIHAPARGAIRFYNYYAMTGWFQFTHPQGVRFLLFFILFSFIGFNSRTRKGCDDNRQNEM